MATDHPGHMHLPRADAIHSRRVDLEFFQDSSQPVPLFTTREILDPSYQKPIGLRDQHQQVLFSTKPRHLGRVSHAQRLLCRFNVRHSPWPPLSLWAEWVIEHPWFKNFINFLIILNVVVRMVIIELLDSTNNSLWPLKLSLEVAVWFILPIFIVEILLKWVASFSLFWKNAWNVFDFVVTLLPLLYEILVLGGVTGHPVWLELLSICGVMRCFRLYAQLHQVRVIILALVRTFKSIRFHFMLLLLLFYIFAVAGVYFFKDYTRSTHQDLVYREAFLGLPNSLITVFILFTMDHWNSLLRDIWKVPEVSSVISSTYIILWVLLGSIILRNVIISTMANNFRDIRDELDKEMAHLAAQHKADVLKLQILRRRQNQSFTTLRSSHSKISAREVSRHRTSLDFQEASSEKESKHSTVEKEVTLSSKPTKESLFKRKESSSSSSTSSSSSEYGDQVDWENLVHQNLPELMEMDQDQYTLWPRNLLLRYLELLEELQYNLEERKELQRLAGTDEIPKEVTPTTNGFKIFGPSKR
ncbi:cation channel sperm-associated protein 2 isoform X1 [Fukomys damarensis]|uniref:cation channel sperm-associated protein 2 isoform X1 n=1 Tax=Fukomys damarensis TaxID=885580 RepID=UPI00053FB968|nr:cation channel sperm-associated protein 2 isoform X1 [Fukomys damarensis]